MPDKIDYKFIGELEGGRLTKGYVPAPTVSRSGVTIATGFDLGQRNENDLKSLNLSVGLIDKLKPYAGHSDSIRSRETRKTAIDLCPLLPLKLPS